MPFHILLPPWASCTTPWHWNGSQVLRVSDWLVRSLWGRVLLHIVARTRRLASCLAVRHLAGPHSRPLPSSLLLVSGRLQHPPTTYLCSHTIIQGASIVKAWPTRRIAQLFHVWLGITWAPMAALYQSAALACGTVASFYYVLGFGVHVGRLCYAIGFNSEAAM